MTDEEMEELQNSIVAGIADYFNNYDWDVAFTKYLEDK
jgi:hypothetical protein